MESGVTRYQLDVLLGGTELERDRWRRQSADDVDKEPAGENDHALAQDIGFDRDTQADVGVGRAELAAVAERGDLNS